MLDDFKVAIASGKGGTGKTTVAANLARAVCDTGQKVQYLDCDVEEPNGHIFLRPKITTSRQVTIDVPQVDPEKCTACGQCGQMCQYGAIVCIKENVLTFEQLCHACGGCFRICPDNALIRKPLEIGAVECGTSGQIDFVSGRLNIGHVRTPTLIKEVKKHIRPEGLAILDVPPGTSCPVVEAIKETDFVLLVTEPTPFGLNDLKLAVELVRELNLPFAVVVNRNGVGDEKVEEYCEAEAIEIAARLPEDRRIAEAYSSGKMIVDVLQEYVKLFSKLYGYLEGAKSFSNKRRVDGMDKYLQSCKMEFWKKVFNAELEYAVQELKGAKDVLSVGCGPAIIEAGLAEHGINVTGLDVSKEALNQAPDRLRTVTGSAENMDFPESCFDAVIYIASIQFIEKYKQAVKETIRVLKQDGQLLVLLLNPESEFFKKKSQKSRLLCKQDSAYRLKGN